MMMMMMISVRSVMVIIVFLLYHTTSRSNSALSSSSRWSPMKDINSQLSSSSSTSTPQLYTIIKYPDKLIIKHPKGDFIEITTISGNVTIRRLDVKHPIRLSTSISLTTCHGILGLYQLAGCHLIAVIADSNDATEVPIPGIRKVVSVQLVDVPMDGGPLHRSSPDKLKRLLLDAFHTHVFYYSTGDYDISRSLQSNFDSSLLRNDLLSSSSSSSSASIGAAVDRLLGVEPRFFWNLNNIGAMATAGCHDFVTPVVNAWIGSETIEYGETRYNLTLISRRSRRRQGPRYIKRGSDEFGDVANFVETEQILQRLDTSSSSSSCSSFVQIRGSIPLFWEQPSAWRLQPAVTASPNRSTHREALQSHLTDIADTYLQQQQQLHTTAPPYSCNDSSYSHHHHRHQHHHHHYRARNKTILLINLIDKKGMQGSLGRLLFMTMMDIAATAAHSSSHSTGMNDSDCRPAADPSGNTSSLSVDEQHHHHLPWGLNISEERVIADLLDRNHTSFHRFGIRVPISNQQQSCTAGASSLPSLSSLSSLPVDVCLLWFDYHHKCRGGVSSILELFAYIQPYISSMDGMFVHRNTTLHDFRTAGSTRGIGATPTAARSYQRHIVRTNCMDCLDRTNVVQTAVSRWALLRQMAALTTSSTAHRRRIDAMNHLQLGNDQVEGAFRRLWTAHGDHISIMYAGSRAMKRDVTRTGVRTRRGRVEDLASYLKRFYANNMRDHHRQRAIDLLIGTTTTANASASVTANANASATANTSASINGSASANASANGSASATANTSVSTSLSTNASASVGNDEALVGAATAVGTMRSGDEEINDSVAVSRVSDRPEPEKPHPPPPPLLSIVPRAARKGKPITASIAYAKKGEEKGKLARSRRLQGPLDRRRKHMLLVEKGAEKGTAVCDEMTFNVVVKRERDANRSEEEVGTNSSAVNSSTLQLPVMVQENDRRMGVGEAVGDVLLSQRACIDDALQAIRTEFLEHD